MKPILLWIRIIRPQTLFASLCPVLIGLLVVAQCSIGVDALGSMATVLCALALQVLSNLINDLYDYKRGADKAGRAGFKRALSEGEVSEKQIKRACLITLAIALILGLYLVLRGGWVIIAIGISALLFAWLYTATAHSLSYLGIADIFVYLYFGILATMGTIWLQLPYNMDCKPLLIQGFWGGSVCGLISMGVLMINNLRDIESDRVAGKRTLPVRWGKHCGQLIMLLSNLAAIACAWVFAGWIPALVIAIPLLAVWYGVLKAQGAGYNRYLMATGLINTLFVLSVWIVRL